MAPRSAQPVPVHAYLDCADALYVPRVWAARHCRTLGSSYSSRLAHILDAHGRLGEPATFALLADRRAALFDYQRELIELAVARQTGIICIPCGAGKTATAIALAARLGRKTLFVVHRDLLREVFVREIAKFCGETVRVGIIQGPTVDVGPDCPVCVAMIQSLVSHRYAADVLDSFGTVIFDEAHHVGASTFNQVASLFRARYRFGISATPEREDGLQDLLEWTLGAVIVPERTAAPATSCGLPVKVVRHRITYEPPLEEILYGDKRPARAIMEKRLARIASRTAIIVDQVCTLVRRGRHVLVLTKLLAHLDAIRDRLAAALPALEIGVVKGGMKSEAIAEASKRRVIIATFGMANEGFNVPRLDSLVLAMGVGRPKQAVGRVLRAHPDKRGTVVVHDLADTYSVFDGMAFNRLRFYRAEAYTVTTREHVIKTGRPRPHASDSDSEDDDATMQNPECE